MLGEQCDAAEFLYFLLGDMIQASFGYLRNIPQSYENNHLTFIPQVFQGLQERKTICSLCKYTKTKTENFLTLNLVSVLLY